jgi:hypothetical protein
MIDRAALKHTNGFEWSNVVYRSTQEIVTFCSPIVMSNAAINMGADYTKVGTISLTAPLILIPFLTTKFTTFTWNTVIFTAIYLFKLPQKISNF